MEEEALREAMEDAFLEGAVQWRADTILQTLRMDKLDEWIRGAGLGGDIDGLKSEIDEVKATVSDVKGRAIGNRRLARSLAALKHKLFDADDAIDELDYYRLLHQVEGGQHPLPSSSNTHNCVASHGVTQPCTPAATNTPVTLQEPEGMHEAARVDHGTSRGDDNIPPRSGRGKKRSKAWDDFEDIKDDNGKTVHAECRHCKKRVQYKGAQGTRVLITHVNSTECKNTREACLQPPSRSSIDDAIENAIPVAPSNSPSRPRIETNQESTQITASITHPWSKDEISSRIQEITHQLQGIRGDVTKVHNMLGSHSGASSGHHQSIASDPRRRTSSLLQGKVYGRDEEKNSIIKLMTAGKSESVTVVPIVGIGGTGKTALAQFVYNDLKVQNQFDHMIWIWVSNSFDEIRITREMLDIVPREKHKGLCSLDKLQQVLKTHIDSKRVLLVLDDVWDDKNSDRLDLILAPFKSDNSNGNVILVTTRSLSVTKRIGMTEPVVLHALRDEDLWLLLKARAFLDENYEGNLNLTNIGWKIAGKLKGNPLAAVTAGELLRVDLTVDHWIKILKDEDGKLLGHSGGIMAALKVRYDQLPYHLQQCFSYCSIFPGNHRFLGKELVHIWISQGFVKQTHPNKRLEEIGMDYLADLVNLGYFQQVGRQNSYAVCGLMHDFARMVSRTDCAIIDGLQCNDIWANDLLPTVRHLSIVYSYQHITIHHNNKFVEQLRNAIASVVAKLRSLVLIGHYESSFFQSFQDIFWKAHNLRLLQMSATLPDFHSVCSLVNPTHLRYLKVVNDDWINRDLLQVWSKFCHLQVIDVGPHTGLNVSNGMNYLVSLRHLVAEERVYSSIARIGELTSIQELHNLGVQHSIGFGIIELQSMNELVQLGISQLQDVDNQEEAYTAGLRYKRHLEKLHLSWEDINMNTSNVEYDLVDFENVTSSEPSTSIETEECLATEVLEGLEPHNNLKHLRISGYNGPTSPSWLASNTSVTSLQTLHLEDCGEWRILPSLQVLPFLAKLSLSNLPKVKELSIPSLEELVLIKMPKLERCSCISMRDLNSCLRALMIQNCPALKVFDLFGNDHKFKIEQKSWLPRLCELTLKNCRLLVVPHPLPYGSTACRISMSRVSKFPRIEVSSSGSLTVGKDHDGYYYAEDRFDKFSEELLVLDGNILAFHNLRFLTRLSIGFCRKLKSISLNGLSQLESLKTLRIKCCPRLSNFEHTPEDLTAANCNALPSLENLEIGSCDEIAWMWLSLILRHAPSLTDLDLSDCPKLEYLQLNSCTALEKLSVNDCGSLSIIVVLQSHSLGSILVREVPNLESLQLHSCTALEELDIRRCTSLSTLDGFQSLGSLRRLYLRECPGLHSSLECMLVQDHELCSQLEFLEISDFSFLTTSFCKQLTSLQRLVICGLVDETTAEGLTDEQERGLLLLGSLTQLHFTSYKDLKYLPAGLHRLHSLQVLEILDCPSISGLPVLPPSLEELRIFCCSEELKHQSKLLASSKLKVRIDKYVN